ncbi:MAG TPA: hypothetical protein VGP04_15620 [Pseudonocardiaceae bacterium]|nr:hypothetical protein [Pseudonocardiaceae bacterium]
MVSGHRRASVVGVPLALTKVIGGMSVFAAAILIATTAGTDRRSRKAPRSSSDQLQQPPSTRAAHELDEVAAW